MSSGEVPAPRLKPVAAAGADALVLGGLRVNAGILEDAFVPTHGQTLEQLREHWAYREIQNQRRSSCVSTILRATALPMRAPVFTENR